MRRRCAPLCGYDSSEPEQELLVSSSDSDSDEADDYDSDPDAGPDAAEDLPGPSADPDLAGCGSSSVPCVRNWGKGKRAKTHGVFWAWLVSYDARARTRQVVAILLCRWCLLEPGEYPGHTHVAAGGTRKKRRKPVSVSGYLVYTVEEAYPFQTPAILVDDVPHQGQLIIWYGR